MAEPVHAALVATLIIIQQDVTALQPIIQTHERDGELFLRGAYSQSLICLFSGICWSLVRLYGVVMPLARGRRYLCNHKYIFKSNVSCFPDREGIGVKHDVLVAAVLVDIRSAL